MRKPESSIWAEISWSVRNFWVLTSKSLVVKIQQSQVRRQLRIRGDQIVQVRQKSKPKILFLTRVKSAPAAVDLCILLYEERLLYSSIVQQCYSFFSVLFLQYADCPSGASFYSRPTPQTVLGIQHFKTQSDTRALIIFHFCPIFSQTKCACYPKKRCA